MFNFKLNFGGIFGALASAGVTFAVLCVLNNGGFPRRGFRLIGWAAFGGATLGNWIWSLAQPPNEAAGKERLQEPRSF